MGCLAEYDKHSSDVLDISPDYADWLAGDIILTSAWEGDGLTVNTDSFTDTTTTVKLSGGILPETHDPKNTITTQRGLTEVRRVRIVIKDLSTGIPIQVGWTRGTPG